MKGERKAHGLLDYKMQATTAYIQDVDLCHIFCSHNTGPSQCFHYNGIHLLFFNQAENTRKLAKNP